MPSTYKLPHPDARHPEANRRKYGGKELLTEGGLNEYDFEARRLTPLGSFSQPDPLAGTLTDPETGDRLPVPYLCHISPYAYCAADPINSIDPTGLFEIENREELMTSTVICVYPEKEIMESLDDKGALMDDYEAAVSAGVPIVLAKDINDMVDGFKSLNLDFIPKVVTINSHGNVGVFSIGGQGISAGTDFSDLSTVLSNKEVFIGACDVGKGVMGAESVETMSEKIGCILVASEHPVPTKYDYKGGDGLNDGVKGTPNYENTYIVSKFGGEATRVTNVRIFKSFGITWDSKGFKF